MSTKQDFDQQEFEATVKHILDEADARMPRLNKLVEHVASLGLLDNDVLLGDVILLRPHTDGAGSADSEQVLRATILFPDGIGATVWDAEEYDRFEQVNGMLEQNARAKFVPFAQLNRQEKALLAMFTTPLLGYMCTRLMPIPGCFVSGNPFKF